MLADADVLLLNRLGDLHRLAAFERAGPLAETLATNSDTEYCCRLYGLGLRAWYTATPGIVIHDHGADQSGEIGNVTHRTKAADRAASFRHIARAHRGYLARDASAALFVHQRWLKHARRAGQTAETAAAIAEAPRLGVKIKLTLHRLALGLFDKVDDTAPEAAT